MGLSAALIFPALMTSAAAPGALAAAPGARGVFEDAPTVSAQSGNPPLDPHQLLAGLRDLESSEVQRKLVRVEGHLAYRYITDAGSLTLPRAVDVAAGLNS